VFTAERGPSLNVIAMALQWYFVYTFSLLPLWEPFKNLTCVWKYHKAVPSLLLPGLKTLLHTKVGDLGL
jgi:hypothetical protein